MDTRGRRRGIFFTIASAVLFGITPAFSRQAILEGNRSETVALCSTVIALAAIGGIIWERKTSLSVTRRQLFHLLWIGGIGQGGTSLFLYQAYAYLPAGTATLVHFLYPALVYGALILFFHERPRTEKLCSLGAAMAGLAVFLEPGTVSAMGLFFAVLSALTFSSYMVGMDKAGMGELPSMTVVFYATLFASVLLFLYNLMGGSLAGGIYARGIFWAALCALGSNVLGKLFLQQGIGMVGAGTAAVLSLFEPITSLVIGVLVCQDGWSLRKSLGCGLILGAVFVISGNGSGDQGKDVE